ncbi:MAG TPA: hypothetical protein ENI19_03605 [Candidatus Nealsonbacteria bacterium]|uniref:Uncharacterized protein n=1 Tax=marine sediment metagenome TaxID=412755 RepID=A0A0F9YEJ7_9ZZZZ|nr:hypothetical protein [Candidatus Nealsonbacteria bacterium]HEB46762.1 hypothetical protein [Candidatus Nealsonbacteria bacterium]
MNFESIIKGRIASIITSLMFQDADYLVVNYGHESIPDRLVQLGVSKDGKAAEVLLTSPSFIVMNKKDRSVNLLQIRYQGEGASGRNIIWRYEKMQRYWPGSHLLLVRPRKPYFFIMTVTKNGPKPIPLIDSKIFNVDKGIVLKFGQFVKKFLS